MAHNSKQSGFTLVELLVAITIFATFMVVSSSSLVQVVKLEQKANILRKTQQDTRFILESIARDAREANGELDKGGTRIAHAYNKASDGSLEILYTNDNKVYKTIYRLITLAGTEENVLAKTEMIKNVGDSDSVYAISTNQINLNNPENVKITGFEIEIDSPPNIFVPPFLNITLNSESGRGMNFPRDEYRAHVDLETSISPRAY